MSRGSAAAESVKWFEFSSDFSLIMMKLKEVMMEFFMRAKAEIDLQVIDTADTTSCLEY